jgi:DnaJ-domain-containing protein 1
MAKVVDTTYYDLLKVPPTASQLDIKKSYRKLAIIHHPGMCLSRDKRSILALLLPEILASLFTAMI